MPRGKAKTPKGFLLLDTKNMTFEEYQDKKMLAQELKKKLDQGASADQLKVVPDKPVAYHLEANITFRQRKPRAKK